MINKYLEHLQEDNLNEFVMIPVIVMAHKIYKHYLKHKEMAKKCTHTFGINRKKCMVIQKIKALRKAKTEVNKFKATCKRWSNDIPKCLSKVSKEISKINKEINKLKLKLRELQRENG